MVEFLKAEKGNLEQDAKSLYGYVEKNWKRIVAWAAVYYAGQHYGPVGASKAQAILKVLGIGG